MNSNDFTTVNHILADVLVSTNDENLASGRTKGWYISQIQQAIEELSFDTFFDRVTRDFDMPDNFMLDLPKNCFNIREVYLHNGTCCATTTSVIVHHKRLFNNKPYGESYTALRTDDKTGNSDPFYPNPSNLTSRITGESSDLYYYNIQNGMLMLSSECSGYEKVRIIYNGMGGEIGDEPIIPRFFRQAVKDWVVERFWESMKSKGRQYAANWQESYNVLHNRATGSWNKARMRITSMDTKEKESLRLYWSRGNW